MKTNANRTLAVQRWRQGLGAWLALALMVGTLLAPLLLAEPAVAKPGGKHHGRGHHGQVHHGGGHQDKEKSGGKHCVAELVEGGGEPQNMTCYRTFEQAQAAATGGTGNGPHAENYKYTVIGILYRSSNYSPNYPSVTLISTSGKGCSSGLYFAFDQMPVLAGYNWNNYAQSAQVFSGCKATYYNWDKRGEGGGYRTGIESRGYDIMDFKNPENPTDFRTDLNMRSMISSVVYCPAYDSRTNPSASSTPNNDPCPQYR